MQSDKIFSRDAQGKIRVWQGEAVGNRWRSCTGIYGGQLVLSMWTETTAKSQPTGERQAIFEMEAQRDKLLGKDYRRELTLVDVPRGSFIKPMLASKYPGWNGPCFLQPKLDGMRCLANLEGLWSRGNKPIVAAPHIFNEMSAIFAAHPKVVFDGEIYNHERYDDFNGLMSIARKTQPNLNDLELSEEVLQYHIYDCFFMDDPTAIFEKRMQFVHGITFHDFGNADPNYKYLRGVTTYCCTDAERVNELHMQMVGEGYEGSIIRLNRPYEQKRSHTLQKNKDWITEEFQLTAIEEGEGNWAGFAKTARCKTKVAYAKDETFGAGIKGDKSYCRDLLNVPASKFQSVTVRHFGMTPDGSYRFPIAIDFNEFGSLEKRPVINSENTEDEL
jgi:DNA ligase-1